ncbi:hypothetical protein [Nocardia vulneris]|uniref:hypothetical protein n=1 Tax=Nocardia vulneris TaxID=1141657 RepID=UPI000B0E4DC0|nr:hypothetical protein [Nocardia vulneris]
MILQLLFGTACIGIGFFAGLSMSWREYKFGDKHIAAPTLPHTDRQQAYVLVVVGVLSVASVAYGGMQSAAQAECNREFRESLVARSKISTENQRQLDTMMGVIADSISNPQSDSRERTQKAILDYRVWSVSADQQRAANPIGDPVCGGG